MSNPQEVPIGSIDLSETDTAESIMQEAYELAKANNHLIDSIMGRIAVAEASGALTREIVLELVRAENEQRKLNTEFAVAMFRVLTPEGDQPELESTEEVAQITELPGVLQESVDIESESTTIPSVVAVVAPKTQKPKTHPKSSKPKNHSTKKKSEDRISAKETHEKREETILPTHRARPKHTEELVRSDMKGNVVSNIAALRDPIVVPLSRLGREEATIPRLDIIDYLMGETNLSSVTTCTRKELKRSYEAVLEDERVTGSKDLMRVVQENFRVIQLI